MSKIRKYQLNSSTIKLIFSCIVVGLSVLASGKAMAETTNCAQDKIKEISVGYRGEDGGNAIIVALANDKLYRVDEGRNLNEPQGSGLLSALMAAFIADRTVLLRNQSGTCNYGDFFTEVIIK